MRNTDLLQRARVMRNWMELNAENMSDDAAMDLPEVFPQWKTGEDYSIGERVRYADKLYKCVQAHKSQADWTPDVVPALWTEIAPEGVIPEWRQPTGASDAYMYGDVVMFNGIRYVSTADTNVWAPGTFGWELA